MVANQISAHKRDKRCKDLEDGKTVFTKTKTNKTLIIENPGKTSGNKSKTRS